MTKPTQFIKFTEQAKQDGLEIHLHGQVVDKYGKDLRCLTIVHANGYSLSGYVEFYEHGFQLFMPLHDRNLFSADIDALLERAND
jgi:hypothetical protein